MKLEIQPVTVGVNRVIYDLIYVTNHARLDAFRFNREADSNKDNSMDKSPADMRDADMVCEIVSAVFDIRIRDLHIARHAVARDVAIYFARFCASVPAAQVAERFNMKPAAIRSAVAAHEERCAHDAGFSAIANKIERVVLAVMMARPRAASAA
jgi:chromosomal replication initiation ATPase DnaA